MNYVGDFPEDQTVYIPFNTFDSNDPSASVTITDLAQGDVEIWKNGVVQPTPGAGVTLTLNIGTNNGSHLIAVDTSNTTDASWFVTGADYQARINGTTVDAATINAWVGSFSTENRFMRGTDSAALATVLGAAVGASISADIADIPTVAEFEARTIVSADYVVVGDTIAAVTLVNGLAANVITAASINADAITAAKIADDAIAAIWAKAMVDLAQAAPSATASVLVAINYIYEFLRNKTTTTATLITVMKDDGSTGLVKSTISDDGTTFTKGEFITGA